MAKSEIIGIVVSDKMAKSVVVTTERQVRDSLYGKQLRRTSRFMAHDEKGEAKPGDRVKIEETRPLSKLKRWRLVQVVAHGEAATQTAA